jgi:hypothetical protein
MTLQKIIACDARARVWVQQPGLEAFARLVFLPSRAFGHSGREAPHWPAITLLTKYQLTSRRLRLHHHYHRVGLLASSLHTVANVSVHACMITERTY